MVLKPEKIQLTQVETKQISRILLYLSAYNIDFGLGAFEELAEMRDTVFTRQRSPPLAHLAIEADIEPLNSGERVLAGEHLLAHFLC